VGGLIGEYTQCSYCNSLMQRNLTTMSHRVSPKCSEINLTRQ